MNHDPIELITPEILLQRVRQFQMDGYRLVQISATRFPTGVELTYSFDLNNQMRHVRYTIPASDSRVPSISSVYACAVLYENEIHDLFDVKVEGLALDFGGNFYRTAVKFPFASPPPAGKAPGEAAAAAPRENT